MRRTDFGWAAWILLGGMAAACVEGEQNSAFAQEMTPAPRSSPPANANTPEPFSAPSLAPCDKPLPIDLATALQLANSRALDIALASQRIRVAAAQLEQARVLWLPTLYLGADYLRHEGRIQDTQGNILSASKGAFMAGAGPVAVVPLTDAFFAPLAARQVVRAREAGLQTATNDTLLVVAEAYCDIQQARGELAGAQETVRRAEDLVRRTEQLAEGLAPPVEAARARADLEERREDAESARERWRLASANLVRILRLEASVTVEPIEPPHLQVTLVALDRPLDDLIPIALTNRPELAAQQALVQATLQRLRQERLRPLIPSIVLHGTSSPPETLGVGAFGGGFNSQFGQFGARSDFDVEVLWELRNLGFGNRALVNERRAEHQLSLLELFRIQDLIASDVAQAYAQAQSAMARVVQAERGLKNAVDSAEKNLEGLSQTRSAGNLILLVVRPQEAVASVQALSRAYNRYYGAVADFNRAQFRLYRAIGQPAQLLLTEGPAGLNCPSGGSGSTSPTASPSGMLPPAPGSGRP
ncbi:MAG TPA: TolC family protein [Gemmataceae bacterium]|nr:TolC family protein [Gemmataceae bacterium]